MKFKYLVLIILIVGFTACSSHSNERKNLSGCGESGPPPAVKQKLVTADEMLNILTDRLNLTSDQVQRMCPVLEDESLQLKKLIQENVGFKEFEKRVSDIEWGVYKKLNKILTEEQMYLYLKYVEGRKDEIKRPSDEPEHGGFGGGPSGPPGGGRDRF